MKKITEQELYYQMKRLRRERLLSNLKGFFNNFVIFIGAVIGLIVIVLIFCGIGGGFQFYLKEDKLATRDELRELNIRVQLLEYRNTPLTIWTNRYITIPTVKTIE